MKIFGFGPGSRNSYSHSQVTHSRIKPRVNHWAAPVLLMFALFLTACGGSDDPGAEPTIYAIGDTGPAGGIVFHITDGGLHGLEASPADQAIPFAPGALWGCFGLSIPGAVGTAIGTGQANTTAIISDCAQLGIAARLADDFILGIFDDWFLPSKDELNQMYLNIGQGSTTLGNVGGFASTNYWSSSEVNGNDAWLQNFGNGSQGSGNGKFNSVGVRAVRAF